ncbi:MAG TPA: hypothetical protein VL173_03215 [Vicinamibacterales bacterium]|nr:hypothetical protein [Vicinamibacterales bacterium]
MTARIIGLVASAAALALGPLGVHVATQTYSTPPPLIITAFGEHPVPAYKAPRTPWGEPDLQGTWSSDDTDGIPMARPRAGGRGGRGGGAAATAPATGLYRSDADMAQRQAQLTAAARRAETDATSSFRFDFGRRAFPQTSLIVDPADGQMPAYTDEGRKRPMPRGTYGNGPLNWTTDFSLYERCITRGIIGSSVRVIYGNGQRIQQAPGVVALSYEMVHDTRIIYTDGRPHLAQPIRQYLGDARGHWEGDELVVETTNLTDQTAIGLNGNGNRDSTQMKLTERFKRIAPDIVQYQVTVDDPVTYVRPFTLSYPLTPLDGGELLAYECHEGNMALRQALGAERAEDRAVEEDRKRGINRPRRPIQDGLGVGGQPTGPGGGGGLGGGRAGGAPPAGQ